MQPMKTGQPANDWERLDKYKTLLSQLETDRSTWDSHWRELSEWILPRRSRWQTTDRNQGTKKNDRIIDGTATMAARTLAAGLMSGLTSPSRPWFKLGVPDPALRDDMGVKRWLEVVENRMREVMLKSNLYTSLSLGYADLGTFGTHAMLCLEDDDDVVRFYPLPLGSYWLANDHRGQVNTLIRKWRMTVSQLVDEFGLDNVSLQTKSQFQSGATQSTVEVVHVIAPNATFDPGKIGPDGMRWASDYYEHGQMNGKAGKPFLRRSGYQTFPVLAPRWATTGEDVYGYGPGMDALGDVKALQVLQKRKAQAVDKMVNPPLKGPSSLMNRQVSLLPGAITWVDGPTDGLSPIHEVRFDIGAAIEDIREHQARIRSALYQDLFLMLQQSDRRDITATEIQAREQERMLQLGPVLERLNDELLDPLIDRVFDIMARRGMIPEPPQILEGMDLRVEYISIMAQAQRMLGISNVDRLLGFVGNLSAVAPEAMDRVNVDETVAEYGDMLGVSPKILRGDDEVAEIRAQRQQAIAQQQQAEQGLQQAQAAKVLSETDTRAPSALNDLVAAARGMR